MFRRLVEFSQQGKLSEFMGKSGIAKDKIEQLVAAVAPDFSAVSLNLSR
jgi:hypothetical protein